VKKSPACCSTLLWSAAVIVFLIGLISEQITNLTYKREG